MTVPLFFSAALSLTRVIRLRVLEVDARVELVPRVLVKLRVEVRLARPHLLILPIEDLQLVEVGVFTAKLLRLAIHLVEVLFGVGVD